MSRAPGKDALAALKASDPTAAYDAVSRALTPSDTTALLEIEILPRSHAVAPGTYLLQDANALAVPKLSLLQAFVVARQVLLRHRQGHGSSSSSSSSSSSVTEDDVLAATAVLLLTDPEHLTAANTRKRLLLGAAAAAAGLAREKHLIDSLLTSRLHRHTKSPTLWSHRRWLVQQTLARGLPVDLPGDMVRVVLVSGERHPRNYYAWSHARWLVAALAAAPVYRRDHDVAAEGEALLAATKAWCFGHHTDVSGWTFLWSLLWGGDAPPAAAVVLPAPEGRSAVFVEIARLAAALRWDNESVWALLRTVAASGLLGRAEEAEFLVTLETLRARSPPGSAEAKTLLRAEEWVGAYHKTAGKKV